MIALERNNMKKISVVIASRHYTSITLEKEFYDVLQQIAREKKQSINSIVTDIDIHRDESVNLSSAIRIYVLKYLQSKMFISV